MNNDLIDAAALGGSVPDFSMWGLFTEADPVVKGVLILLVLSSVWCWAIIFEKWI